MSTPEIKRLFGDPVPFALKELACNVAEVYAETTAARDTLQRKIKQLNAVSNVHAERIWDLSKLKPRNVGGHHYPGITSAGYEHGSKCDYCDCFMGASTSSAPDGVDQFGECPGNPDLRPEYDALQQRVAELELQLADMKAAEIGLAVRAETIEDRVNKQMKEILTTAEVAKIIGTTPRHVARLFDSGKLRGYRIPGSQDRRIPLKHLRQFVEENLQSEAEPHDKHAGKPEHDVAGWQPS